MSVILKIISFQLLMTTIDEKELESRTFKESSAQWLGYNTNIKNYLRFFSLKNKNIKSSFFGKISIFAPAW